MAMKVRVTLVTAKSIKLLYCAIARARESDVKFLH